MGQPPRCPPHPPTHPPSPSLLFLDEPTTGLDSLAALTVMRRVRALADGGANVLAAIHQPRPAIWELFDKVGPAGAARLPG
jgi:ABC-type multidrug transport system ATPase subunit